MRGRGIFYAYGTNYSVGRTGLRTASNRAEGATDAAAACARRGVRRIGVRGAGRGRNPVAASVCRTYFRHVGTYAGDPVPFTHLRYIKPDEAPLESVDAVFLALPHGVSAQTAKKAEAHNVRVIDLSADLRLDTPELYQKWYSHPHPHPELLPTPYGLQELNRDALRGVERIAAPGCYPTTTLLGVYPLLHANWLVNERPMHRGCQVRCERCGT